MMRMRSGSIPRHRQQGAALLMAMVIVTLVATLSATMVWQQWRAVQVESAERVRTQATWVLSGALDWAMLILREDQRSGGPDHLGEPWAIPLAEARLSTFLAADTDNNAADEGGTPEAFLSGQVEDATARYNLRNVLSAEGELVPDEVAVLRRLCENAGLSPALAEGLASAWRRASSLANAKGILTPGIRPVVTPAVLSAWRPDHAGTPVAPDRPPQPHLGPRRSAPD